MSSCLSFFSAKASLLKSNQTYFIIIIVAFTQGVLGLSELSVSYLYKDDFKLTPAQVSVCTGLTSLPWIIKPVWGVISDSFYFLGYRRKSYLIFFGFLECVCWLSLASWVMNPYQGVIILLIVQLAVAFCNVIGEALLVEVSRDSHGLEKNESDHSKQEKASKNVSLFFGVRSFGVFLTAYTGGLLLEYLHKKTIFGITSFFPLILALFAFGLKEKKKAEEIPQEENKGLIHNDIKNEIKKEHSSETSTTNIKKVWNFVRKPDIYKPIFFIFFFIMTPSASSSMFYFYTNELKFHSNFMGQLKLIHSLASILGIFIYHRFLKLIPFKKMLGWSTVICACTGMTQVILVTRKNVLLGIPDKFFSIGDSLVIQTFAEINTIPMLVLACRLCPKNIEGTMYALLMSTLNFGSMLSYQFGGLLMHYLEITENDFHNLWILIVLANTFLLLPLPFLSCVDFRIKDDEIEHASNGEKSLNEEETQQNLISNEEKQGGLKLQHEVNIITNSGMNNEEIVLRKNNENK